MNDIKEDLALMELERLEYFNYFILILKNNILNFLFMIVIMILLNTLLFYKTELSYYFSGSLLGEYIYIKLNNLGFGKLIDEGLGTKVMQLGLYYRSKEFIEGFASYIKWLCYIGMTISTSKYIESNLKTNPVFEIIKSFFRIGKLTFLILISGIFVSEIKQIIFRNKFTSFLLLIFIFIFIYKCIFIIQEYFYYKNSFLSSLKHSFTYIDFKTNIIGLGLLIVPLNLIVDYTFPSIAAILLNTFLEILIIIFITLSYFNIKYLKDKRKLEGEK